MSGGNAKSAKIGVALGGGGARGIAYIGVLKAFQENGFKPDLMVGTSIGALAAVMWAYRQDWEWLKKKTLDFLTFRKFRKYGMGLGLSEAETKASLWQRAGIWSRRILCAPRFFLGKGLFSNAALREAVEATVPDVRFEDLDMKAAAVALDLVSTEEVIISEGDCRRACWTSANLAGFFPPVADGDRLLIDASSIASVPAGACRRLGADKIVGIDLRSPIPQIEGPEGIRTALDAVLRLGVIGSDRANQAQIDLADLLVRPAVGDVFWSDFRDVERLIEEGEKAALEHLPDLKAVFDNR